jgi:outer membrane lipoprotein carrier protein
MTRHLLVCLLTAGLNVAAAGEVPAALQAFYDGTTSLTGEFEQRVFDPDGVLNTAYGGHFWLVRPGRFRWEYGTPYQQLIVSDGARVWFYDPDLEQVTIRRLDGPAGALPTALLSGDTDLSKSFIVAASETDVNWVDLTPLSEDAGFTRVRLYLPDGELVAMVLEDGLGQTTEFDFRELARNAVVDPARFRFQPPAGVDIIEE